MKIKTLLILVFYLLILRSLHSQCGQISLIGEFSGWVEDLDMVADLTNPNYWRTTLVLFPEDDVNGDHLVELKFRENHDWTVNWGASDFPGGIGLQDGPNIPVPISEVLDSTWYYVGFDCLSGQYTFGFTCEVIGLIGEFSNWNSDIIMQQDEYFLHYYSTFININEEDDIDVPPDGFVGMKFRENENWYHNWGNVDFPVGIGIHDGYPIPVPYYNVGLYTDYYVSFHCDSHEYYFEETCGDISLIGEFSNWGGLPDHNLIRSSTNIHEWTTVFQITEDDDQSMPLDGIVEIKIREYNDWEVNWGDSLFPAGTGYQDGYNIPVPLLSWVDTTSYFLTFNCLTGEYHFDCLNCGDISLIGEFSNWTGDHPLEPDSITSGTHTTTISVSETDDLSIPPDGIIEMAFRENESWAVNWSSGDFPSGVGYLAGPNIPVPYNALSDSTFYNVNFNCITGEYNFQEIVSSGQISIIGEFSDWIGDIDMTQVSVIPSIWNVEIEFTEDDDPNLDGYIEMKFRENHDWAVNWGGDDFPVGIAYQDGPNFLVPYNTYMITFNNTSLEYSFETNIGLEESLVETPIKLFPNPAHDEVVIEVSPNLVENPISLIIQDMSGHLVHSEYYFQEQLIEPIRLNMKLLDRGIYLVSILTENRSIAFEKLIVH